jgi:TRAP-type C4-dicarboxylate transport system permease small subunit
MLYGLFKNKKELIIYASIILLSLAVSICLLLFSIDEFKSAKSWYSYYVVVDKHEVYLSTMWYNIRIGLLAIFAMLLIVFLNVFQILKLKSDRTTPEQKAENKRRRLQRKINKLDNESKKLERKD